MLRRRAVLAVTGLGIGLSMVFVGVLTAPPVYAADARGGEDVATFLARLVPTDDTPTLLLVDDLEMVGTDGALTDALVEHLKTLRDRPGLLVGAGTTDELTGAYRGLAAALKKSRSGVLLCPTSPNDGDIFGIRLPRSAVGGSTPGRGVLVTAAGWQVAQVPTP